MRYYFDTLSAHPQPKPLESLTSYLTRLAEENHVSRPQSFLSNFWGKSSPSLNQADSPPVSFGRLPLAAACEEVLLWRTTFYHLGKKFRCSSNQGAIARFLVGSLSQCLRYCPKCIEARGHYSLTWRFLDLSGCAEHGCRLLDRCSHCDQTLPFFTAPLKVGICPSCKGNLRNCLVEQLPQREVSIARTRFDDLAFLLTPHPCEEFAPHLLAALGRQLAQLRQKKQLRQVDVDKQLGYSSPTALNIEHGAMRGNNSLPHHRHSFQRYLKYADLLGVSFFDLFAGALSQKIAGEEPGMNDQQPQVRGFLSYKQDYQVDYVPREPGPTELSEYAIPLQSGGKAKVASLEEQGQEDPSDSLEQEWLDKVRLAYDQLIAREEPVTITAICQTIPVSVPTLSRYPRVQAFLASVISNRRYQTLRRKAQLHEETLVAEVNQAIDHLKIEGHPVTQAAIAELVHLTVQRLRGYPTIKVLLDQISVEEQRAKSMLSEEELLKQMQEAIDLLELQGQRVTQQTVGEILHHSVKDLTYYYPRIKARWQEVRAKRSCQQKIQTKQREEQLLKQTQDAINLLRLEGKCITAIAIAELVGMTVASLKHYPQVALLLDAAVQANRTRKTRESA